MANKILKGDMVILLSGDDKGKKGKVLAVFPKESKVLVEGINVVKRHTKADQKNPKGRIVEKPLPVFLSKVKLLSGDTPVKLAFTRNKEGRLQRVNKKTGKEITVAK